MAPLGTEPSSMVPWSFEILGHEWAPFRNNELSEPSLLACFLHPPQAARRPPVPQTSPHLLLACLPSLQTSEASACFSDCWQRYVWILCCILTSMAQSPFLEFGQAKCLQKISTGVPTMQRICATMGRQFISFQTCPREGKATVARETF